MTADRAPTTWMLTLYVSGASPRSATAIENVRRICDEQLEGDVDLEIIDVRESPALVRRDQVIAVPTLIKRFPAPLRRLVGDLSDHDRVRLGLDLGPLSETGEQPHVMVSPARERTELESASLQAQITELSDALDVIRSGGVDAVITGESGSEQVYTSASADRPYRLLVEEMDEGAATVSDRGVVLYANRCLASMLGRQPKDLVGTAATDFVVSDDRSALKSLLRLPTGEHGRAEVRLAGSGTPVPAAVHAACLDVEGMPVHCLVLNDLTAHKQAAELLEERVRQRTAELEMMNAELDAFSYSVSHDLRAPLRAIGGFAQILAEEHAGALDEEGLRLLGVMSGGVGEMKQIIDDLLALSRVVRGEVERIEIDMDALARSVAAEVGTREPDRDVAVHISPLAPAIGDGHLVRQVWVNLLSNAFKFTAHVAHPRVTVECEQQCELIVYRVRDNGAGFDMAYADKLFGPFQRLHGSEFPGTGIGLAIVKRIVTRHGGWVEAAGVEGSGAVFSFALPAPRSHQRDRVTRVATAPTLGSS